MWKLLFAGLVVSASFLIASSRPVAAQDHEWCTIESIGGASFKCYWNTWDQCRQSKTHLEGGSCFRNPAWAGRPQTDPGYRPVPNISAPSPYVNVATNEAYRSGKPKRRRRAAQ
jgi:hypothetical protein